MEPNTISDISKDKLVCPHCGTLFVQFAGVTPGHSQTVKKGSFWVCAHCGHLSKVGDFNLQMIPDEEFRTLPPHIQQAVAEIVDTLKDTSVKDLRN